MGKKYYDNFRSVYVMESKGGICKIGISYDPEERLKDLLSGHGYKLEIVHVETLSNFKAKLVERTAHKLLERLRREGEWFQISPDKAVMAVKMSTWIVNECIKACNGNPTMRFGKRRRHKKNQNEATIADIREWSSERIEIRTGEETSASTLYDDFRAWCHRAHLTPFNITRFGIFLTNDLGLRKVRSGHIKYQDVSLKTSLRVVGA